MNRIGLVEHRLSSWAVGLVLLAAGVAWMAPALRADDDAQQARAARLSYVDGHVRIAQGSQLLADPALQNTPLFEGTQVLTSEEGRAELQFDDGSVVRISPGSSLTLEVLRGQGGSGDAQIDLTSGLSYFELQGASGSRIRLRFGHNVVTADGFTVLRINLDNPPGELAVFSGNAHLERGSAGAVDLHGGQSIALNAANSIVAESIEPNSWDTWNSDRDQALSTMAVARTGAESSLPENSNPAWNDLDANGNWYNVPGQGQVWSPYDAASPEWDPYGNGNWMWTPRFGYIWVSGDPWGYLPFQCGAWNFYNDFGWGWAPGMCRPWWGGGGWNYNIGFTPGRYRPPVRPHPVLPHGPIGRPMRGEFLASQNAVVPVNRRPPSGTAGMPVRDRNGIVTIGGHQVEPLRPVSQRPVYNRSQGFMNHTQPANTGAATPAWQHPANGFGSGSHPVYVSPARGAAGSQNTAQPNRPSSGGAFPVRPSSGGSAPQSRPSGGGSHPSSGGGGGGGSHPSGGGGGGNSGSSGHH
jgi:hypothetical protein